MVGDRHAKKCASRPWRGAVGKADFEVVDCLAANRGPIFDQLPFEVVDIQQLLASLEIGSQDRLSLVSLHFQQASITHRQDVKAVNRAIAGLDVGQ